MLSNDIRRAAAALLTLLAGCDTLDSDRPEYYVEGLAPDMYLAGELRVPGDVAQVAIMSTQRH